MADTGAPWNIPYVEPTDIPRTYPDDSEDLALAIAAGLSAAVNPGIGSNVVMATDSASFSTTSATLVNWTNVEVTITPTSDTAKVLVMLTGGSTFVTINTATRAVVIARDTTTISIQNTLSSRTDSAFNRFGPALIVLDSPATASAVTYRARVSTSGGTAGFNEGTIIAIEVAA